MAFAVPSIGARYETSSSAVCLVCSSTCFSSMGTCPRFLHAGMNRHCAAAEYRDVGVGETGRAHEHDQLGAGREGRDRFGEVAVGGDVSAQDATNDRHDPLEVEGKEAPENRLAIGRHLQADELAAWPEHPRHLG